MSGQTYQWANQKRSAFKLERWSWSHTWWLFVAVLLAIALHVWLYLLFNNLELGRKFLPQVQKEKARPERIAINPDMLKKQEAIKQIPDTIGDNNIPPEPKVKADFQDIVDMLPADKEMDLTPQVNKVTNFATPQNNPNASNPAQAPSLASIADTMPGPDLASSMSALKSSVLNKAVSPNQMTIPTSKSTDKEIAGLDGKLLDKLSQATAGNGGQTLPGYSNLDDLVNRGSKVSAGTAIAIPTDLLFDYGSDQLAETARLSMMKLGFLIQKNPNSKFVIEGHTDNFGTEAFNRDLGQRRANAVVQFLTRSLQLGSDRIEAVGMGKSRLIVADGTVEEQAPNRRVEIKVRPLR